VGILIIFLFTTSAYSQGEPIDFGTKISAANKLGIKPGVVTRYAIVDGDFAAIFEIKDGDKVLHTFIQKQTKALFITDLDESIAALEARVVTLEAEKTKINAVP